MNIPIRFVQEIWTDDRQGGDAQFHDAIIGGKVVKDAGLHIVCPKCRHLAGVSFIPPHGWTWDGNREAPTVAPSILHDSPHCGWHVYLRAGVFVPC
jgi:hypothetical protein